MFVMGYHRANAFSSPHRERGRAGLGTRRALPSRLDSAFLERLAHHAGGRGGARARRDRGAASESARKLERARLAALRGAHGRARRGARCFGRRGLPAVLLRSSIGITQLAGALRKTEEAHAATLFRTACAVPSARAEPA